MSTPQNPDGSSDGSPGPHSSGQNPNNQPPSAPDYGNDQNAGQQPPQYGSPAGQQPGVQQPGAQQPFGASSGQDQPYGSQPSQPYGSQPGQNQSPYGQDPYGQNQYGQQPYDANASGYDPNQYGQQPAYAADGASDQFVPANPNAAYGQFPAGTGGNTSKNIWGILALIGGIVGVLGAFVFGGGALFGIAAMIFGFVGLAAVKKGLANNKGLNIWGIVLGGASIILSIVVIVATVVFGGLFITAVNEAAEDQKQEENPFAEPSTNPPSTPVTDGSSPGDSSGGSDDGSGTGPVSGKKTDIGDDVTVAVAVGPGTTTGIGAESTNDEIAVVRMTIRNSSNSELDLSDARLTASDGSSTEYDDVFEGDKYKASLVFDDPIPAGSENTYDIAFAVPREDVGGIVLHFDLGKDLGNGTEFEFKKQ